MSGTGPIHFYPKPLNYFPADTITDLDAGVPYVTATGKAKKWEGMPADSKVSCEFKAKGKIWFPQKGVARKLAWALADPVQVPQLLSGVEGAKDLHKLEDADASVLNHVYTLEAGLDFQFLSDVTIRDVNYGVIVEQTMMDHFNAWVMSEDMFSDRETGQPKRTDTLKNYEGRIEILEIANGTVIVMEFSAMISNVQAPDCDYAAGSARISDMIPDFLHGDRAVKRQMEARLKNLYQKAIK